MSTQKTLFPEPEPERHGPISEPLDPNVIYGTLEDDYDESLADDYDVSFWRLSTPEHVPLPEPTPDELPFGIAAYVQELYERDRPKIGETLAMRRVYRIANDYHQIEVPS